MYRGDVCGKMRDGGSGGGVCGGDKKVVVVSAACSPSPRVHLGRVRALPCSRRGPCPLEHLVRRVAMVAYGNNRSFQDLKRVQDLVDSASQSQKILFLPVFFVALDPTRIPSAEELEFLHPDTRSQLACALLALSGALMLIIELNLLMDSEIGPTLWPRVWVYFIYEHHEHLPAAHIRVHEEIYIQFLIYVAHIYGNCSVSKVISSTSGFRLVLAKAWGILPEVEQPALENCLYYLAGFMNVLDFDDPVQFTEIIDGAGGTLDDLARLVVWYIHTVVKGPWKRGTLGLYIRSLVRFIQGFSPKPTALRPQFMETLRHHKFDSPFVVAMATLLVGTGHRRITSHVVQDAGTSFKHAFGAASLTGGHRSRSPANDS
ncbi:hypothetical protein B0H13DRAFT_2282373 [Mycena leptocephala]|nr:hypothetical protein B0H13DRAFT_2282373 [Mycena leptocephala]